MESPLRTLSVLFVRLAGRSEKMTGRVEVIGETRGSRQSQYIGGFERTRLVVTEPGGGASRSRLVPGGRRVVWSAFVKRRLVAVSAVSASRRAACSHGVERLRGHEQSGERFAGVPRELHSGLAVTVATRALRLTSTHVSGLSGPGATWLIHIGALRGHVGSPLSRGRLSIGWLQHRHISRLSRSITQAHRDGRFSGNHFRRRRRRGFSQR